ncbi:hypothetical protein BC829DRAFT_398593 [Chytridium lagenaria]|nr:hypothetical protein BC829DRAFT_398593 [Chytridium lagenaria]
MHKEYFKRVKEENRLRHQCEIERKNRVAAFVSSWQDSALQISHKSDLKQLHEAAKSEIEMANKELLVIRRKEIGELVEEDTKRHREELRQLGLAIHQDRF